MNIKVEFVKTDKDVYERMGQNGNGKPTLIIVDLNNAAAKPLTVIPKLKSKLKKETNIIGFVSHVQGELKMKATEAGCDMVLPRSAFPEPCATVAPPRGSRRRVAGTRPADLEPGDNCRAQAIAGASFAALLSRLPLCCFFYCGRRARSAPSPPKTDSKPTFYKDILPILQDHCQVCHRPGGIAPMPLVTYANAPKLGACHQAGRGVEADAAMVCRSALRKVFQRSLADSAADCTDIGLGRWRRTGRLAERRTAAKELGRRMEHPPARQGSFRCRCPCRSPRTATWSTPTKSCLLDSPKTSGYSSRRFGHRVRNTCITPWCTSARRIPPGCGLHRSECRSPPRASRSQAARRSPRDHDRHAAGVRPRQRARSLARRNREVHSRRLRPGLPDALHHQRHAGSDQTSVGMVFAKQPPKQRVTDAATHQQHVHHSAAHRRLPRRGLGHAAQRLHPAQLLSAHAPARQALRVQHPSSRRHRRNLCCA